MSICDDCPAACCKVFDYVEVCEADVKAIAQATGIPETTLRDEYLHREFLYQGLKIKPCPFIKDNRCSIYEVRPRTCRQFIIGDRQCQDARAMLLDGKPRGFTAC